MAHYYSIKIVFTTKGSVQNLYTKYRDAWVDEFRQSTQIALQAEVAHLFERCVN